MQGDAFFNKAYTALTGYPPLRWQSRLFCRLAAGDAPASIVLPTGLGKTSIIPIWLIALAFSAQGKATRLRLSRRLVYIVNRRTVVDQATDQAARLLSFIYQSGRREGVPWACDNKHVLSYGLARATSTGGACTADDAAIQFNELLSDEWAPTVAALRASLSNISGDNAAAPLAVSTLRGELADNREWKINPARPVIIIGTIDMIGSKLLFSGYGDGRYGRGHHAGLIGQDALIVHDEAHLTPAFGSLLRAVEQEQQLECGRNGNGITRPIRVMELSATSRLSGTITEGGAPEVFGIQDEDIKDCVVQQRLSAKKRLSLVHVDAGKKNDLVGAIADAALQHDREGCRVLIYVRKPDDADTVAGMLRERLGRDGQERVGLLTGTIRGYERDRLAESDLFRKFKADPNRPVQLEQTIYLVSTSAGEVGVDLDSDHLVCDLTTLDGMIQRFGRVNRLGVGEDGQPREAAITVVTGQPDDKDPLRKQLRKQLEMTAEVLGRLSQVGGTYDASPQAVDTLLRTDDAQAAFAPAPKILPVTDILFDAWSLTSIDGEMPGRPAVADYLHGAAAWEPPETFVAWRAEVRYLVEARVDSGTLSEWFEACPILAHERLRDRTDRVRDALDKLLKEHRKRAKSDKDFDVVVLNEYGEARLSALGELVSTPQGRDPLGFGTVVLPVEAGGLNTAGMLDPSATEVHRTPAVGGPPLNEAGILDPSATEARGTLDVAEELAGRAQAAGAVRKRQRWLFIRDAEGERWRHLLTGEKADLPPAAMRERERITLKEQPEGEEDEGDTQALVLFTDPRGAGGESPEQARFRESLTCHQERIAAYAEQIARALGLPDDLRGALVLAARWHDRGKDRPSWQRYANNQDGSELLAKSERYRHWRVLGGYRHEFGSLLEAAADQQIASHPQRDLILHLIAAHHGWARPHFEQQAFDNEGPTDPATGQRRRPTTRQNEKAAVEAIQRFGRLQQRFGRWGLAWLESLLRCADALASSAPESAAAVRPSSRVAGVDSGVRNEAAEETAA